MLSGAGEGTIKDANAPQRAEQDLVQQLPENRGLRDVRLALVSEIATRPRRWRTARAGWSVGCRRSMFIPSPPAATQVGRACLQGLQGPWPPPTELLLVQLWLWGGLQLLQQCQFLQGHAW